MPISLSLAIPQISYLTNTAFLGRLGIRELGVNGIAGIFYLTLAMIGYGLSNGIQIQMARRAGEQDKNGLTKTFTNGAMLAILFAFGLMLLSFWLSPIIFGFSLHESENIYLTLSFLFVRVWGLPFLMLTQVFNAFFIATNRSRVLIYGALAEVAVNIFLDYGLIFGNFGMPALGLTGAAIASVCGEVTFCGMMFAHFFYHRLHLEFPVRRFLRFDLKLSRKSLLISAPLIIQFLFSIGGWQVFFIFVEHIGSSALAASQILRSIYGIVGIGAWALAATCNTMVSNIIGQNKDHQVLSIIRKIATISLSYACIIGVFILLFDDQFLALYRNDAALIAYAKTEPVCSGYCNPGDFRFHHSFQWRFRNRKHAYKSLHGSKRSADLPAILLHCD